MENKPEILIVEDSATQAIEVQYFLKQHHYSVSIAGSGKEAVNLLKTYKPSIIISDIVMPEMNGFELCRFIKNNDTLKDIPVILRTGLSDPLDIIHGIAVGADDYFLKLYKNEDLLKKIDMFLSKPIIHEKEGEHEGLELSLSGKSFTITANRKQILHLLVSTYENVVHQNNELEKAHNNLTKLNSDFESRLKELNTLLENLQNSEDRFGMLVQMIPDIIYRIDDKGRFTFLNNAVMQLGYLPGELIGKHFSVIISAAEVDKVSRSETIKKYYEKQTGIKDNPKLFDERRTGERVTRDLVINLIHKTQNVSFSGIIGTIGKKPVMVELCSSGMYKEGMNVKDGKFIGTVGIIRDISRREFQSGAVAPVNEKLEQKITDETKTIYKSRQDFENALESFKFTRQQVIESEKLASLGALIAQVAHELNNSLMCILNYVQYLQKHIKDEKNLEYLGKTEQEASRSYSILSNLLNYSCPTRDDCTYVSCKDVIKYVMDLIDLDFQKKNIKMIVSIPDTLPLVWAKQYSLQQVFLNLLINARDAMANSPVKAIHINGCRSAGNAQITMQDTGSGIPDDIIRQIFNPFFTTKEPGKGTGLGLSVSHNIIAGFGGKLTCESHEGEGAKFIITLPVIRIQ